MPVRTDTFRITSGDYNIAADCSLVKFSIKLSLFLVVNSKQENNNDSQSSENVESSHNFCNIHKNYSFINETLECQARTEKSNPNNEIERSTDPVMSGPINIEAKNTCPISRKISENTFVLSIQKLYQGQNHCQFSSNKNPETRRHCARLGGVGLFHALLVRPKTPLDSFFFPAARFGRTLQAFAVFGIFL